MTKSPQEPILVTDTVVTDSTHQAEMQSQNGLAQSSETHVNATLKATDQTEPIQQETTNAGRKTWEGYKDTHPPTALIQRTANSSKNEWNSSYKRLIWGETCTHAERTNWRTT